MIKREHYLNQIIDLIDKDIIKILTGVRRSGKSVLLQQVVNHLKNNGIKEENIIFIDLESPDFLSYSTINDLNEYIKSKSNKTDKYYLFFDEIQRIEGWQRLVNAYFSLDNFDVYVTGSNSKLLSGEFATYLTGRYINIKIFPFSFVEYLEYNKDSNLSKKELFMDYLTFGGFPASFELDNKIQYLNDLFDFDDDSNTKNGILPLDPSRQSGATESSDPADTYSDYNSEQENDKQEDEFNNSINSGLNGAKDYSEDDIRNMAILFSFFILAYVAAWLIGLVVMCIVLGVRLSSEKREILQHRQAIPFQNPPFQP